MIIANSLQIALIAQNVHHDIEPDDDYRNLKRIEKHISHDSAVNVIWNSVVILIVLAQLAHAPFFFDDVLTIWAGTPST